MVTPMVMSRTALVIMATPVVLVETLVVLKAKLVAMTATAVNGGLIMAAAIMITLKMMVVRMMESVG